MAIDPHNADALYNKGNALDDLGDHTGVIVYYDKALSVNPKDEDTLYSKGISLCRLRNYAGSYRILR